MSDRRRLEAYLFEESMEREKNKLS